MHVSHDNVDGVAGTRWKQLWLSVDTVTTNSVRNRAEVAAVCWELFQTRLCDVPQPRS